MYHFDVNKAIEDCCRWIQDWFAENGDGCPAVLGISGGKDSSVCAALLCRALGVHRVGVAQLVNAFLQLFTSLDIKFD